MTKIYRYSDFFEGSVIPDQIGAPDRCVFDIHNSGSILLVTLNNPTEYELCQFEDGPRVIRLTRIENAMWLTFCFGELNWMEAPYTPHLTAQAEMPGAIQRACADFMISVVDTVDGMVKYCRRFYFSPEFSNAFCSVATTLYNQDFNREEYDELLNLVQQQYSTEEIARAAMAECRL